MNSLLADIEQYMARRGISDHRFGILAANNGRLVERLREGGEVLPRTEKKIRSFLAEQEEALQHEGAG